MAAKHVSPTGLPRPRRHPDSGDFARRYGPWALILGASEGLGAAYARALAGRGLDVVLVARRAAALDALAVKLRDGYGVKVRCHPGDLGAPGFVDSLVQACTDLEIGTLVYNAAHAPVGEFASTSHEDLMQVVDVNVRAPLTLVRSFLPHMLARRRGAVILMTSLAGNQGSPQLAAYAASKAFVRELAESLWFETKERGVDVIACCAGAVRTPGYTAAVGKDAPGTLDPEQVVERALRALGRGPVVIPGSVNKLAAALLGRLLPRRAAIAIMAGSTRGLAPAHVPAPEQKQGS